MIGCTVLRIGFRMGEFRLFWLWCLFFHLFCGAWMAGVFGVVNGLIFIVVLIVVVWLGVAVGVNSTHYHDVSLKIS